ncbi:HAD family phosphatase [uncultured Bacteroides sp.]|uniref:HAD family hydrolase n=1 Tax=uncultured Bacteroides sp. TaxID=162156 RepID=UPI002AA91D66|nr:HAD family phosphatase [uncultured Bacteroides sp.]
MDELKTIAALFDFDGVIMDTEGQYTVFWDEQGRKYLNVADFGTQIKGQTLGQIYDKHFAGMHDAQQQIRLELDAFEGNMVFEYIPGAEAFLADLRSNGVKIAMVTSSNEKKMGNVYRSHPRLSEKFDRIITADLFTHSKPNPECFLLGMNLFGATAGNTFVFEDSFHGLQAGMSSGATVIGLATTNTREAIAAKAHFIIDDFTGMNFHKLMSLL